MNKKSNFRKLSTKGNLIIYQAIKDINNYIFEGDIITMYGNIYSLTVGDMEDFIESKMYTAEGVEKGLIKFVDFKL